MDVVGTFESRTTHEERVSESERVRTKYPDRIPIIVELSKNSNSEIIPKGGKYKYLVPDSITVGQFLYTIRQKLSLNPSRAIYIFFGNSLPPTHMTIGEIDENTISKSGFLMAILASENTFGS